MRQVLSAWSVPWSLACPKSSKRSRYYRCSGQKGFMLLTYVVGLAVGAALAALVCTGLGRTALSWQRLQERISIVQAGSYMQSLLEKQLAYNATGITITASGSICLNTITGNKKLVIYFRNGGLYLQTTTGNGTGTNPLFIEGIKVTAWQVQKISAQRLRISFALKGQNGERSFEQVLTCYNGEVSYGEV